MSTSYRQYSTCKLCGDVKSYHSECWGDFDGGGMNYHEPDDCKACETLKEYSPKMFAILEKNYLKLKDVTESRDKWRQKAIRLRLELTDPINKMNYRDVHPMIEEVDGVIA